MSEYNVELSWPRPSKQPAYAEIISAPTQAAAIHAAKINARASGWKGEPKTQEAKIIRAVPA